MTNEQFIFIMARIHDDIRKIYHKINQEFIGDADVAPYLDIANFGVNNWVGEVFEDKRVVTLNPLKDFIDELEDHIEMMKGER